MTSTIVSDLSQATNALELLFMAGKAEMRFLDDLRGSFETVPSRSVSNSPFPADEVAKLIFSAREAREPSYPPYSRFNVGAAILAQELSGTQKVFTGCNVENAAYGSTICAERTAAFKAVSEGFRGFLAFAVVGGFDLSKPGGLREAVADTYITPCGSCRQVLYEFGVNPCLAIMASDTGKVLFTTLEYLLPGGFGPSSLGMNPLDYDRHNAT